MNPHNFGPASIDETIVYGAQRPGYPSQSVAAGQVRAWIGFMQSGGIRRVCCLLDEELAYYDDLLGQYRRAFGPAAVCHAPIADYCLASVDTLVQVILPFLTTADAAKEKAVVHCSGGIGRTGHVLAAWLVHRRGFSESRALSAVRHAPGAYRNPLEAVQDERTRAQLDALLRASRPTAPGGR